MRKSNKTFKSLRIQKAVKEKHTDLIKKIATQSGKNKLVFCAFSV